MRADPRVVIAELDSEYRRREAQLLVELAALRSGKRLTPGQCLDCGTAVQRNGVRGAIPRRCPRCTRVWTTLRMRLSRSRWRQRQVQARRVA